MKKTEEIMEILAAYDLTGSFRDAAALVGCDHHTVARYMRARDAGKSVQLLCSGATNSSIRFARRSKSWLTPATDASVRTLPSAS